MTRLKLKLILVGTLVSGVSCSNVHEASCVQRQTCLLETENCEECEAVNFIPVCVAMREVQLAGIEACDYPACREAMERAREYDSCLAEQSCDDWQEAFSRRAFRVSGLCESIARSFGDSLEECRVESEDSCVLQGWSSRRF